LAYELLIRNFECLGLSWLMAHTILDPLAGKKNQALQTNAWLR
jgi:hypothetical protein